MNNQIKTTLVATAVSTALATTATAGNWHSHHQSLKNFDYNVANQASSHRTKSGLRSTQQLAVVSNRPLQGASGEWEPLKNQQDHVNSTLNVTTFSWANRQPLDLATGVLSREVAIAESTKQFILSNAGKHGVTATSLASAQLKSVHDTTRGAIISKYQQRANGLEVFGRQLNVMINQKFQPIATSGYFANVKAPKTAMDQQFKLTASKALTKAFTDMGGDSLQIVASGQQNDYQLFETKGSNSHDFSDKQRTKPGYYATSQRLIPAYFVELIAAKKGSKVAEGYSYIISAEDGRILKRTNLSHNANFTYRVFAEADAPYAPYDSPFGNGLSPHPTGIYDDVLDEVQVSMNEITLEHAGISTNDPWLPAGAQETRGNNVDAYADLVEPDGFTEDSADVRTQISSEGVFSYQFTQEDSVDTEDNINAAIVNLFYVNNYLHDLYYDHGFNEMAGNAQMDNYGRGGVEGDPLHVEAQDGSGLNNANMLTPADGRSPRMQMFLWQSSQSNLSFSELGEVEHTVANFGQTQFESVTAEIIAMTGNGADPNDGCEAATNGADLVGKFALVNRGSCAFTQKTLNAQNAGAIGIIVANNDVDNPDDVIVMGGSDDSVTIPAMMVSYNTGQDLMAGLADGTLEVTASSTSSYRDGTLDNLIVEHEWGHYFTNRLSFGMYDNNQGRSLGEGWSDFIALVSTVREDDNLLPNNNLWQAIYNVGSYALSGGARDNAHYFGIRRVPYTTDVNYNALTFKHIQDQVPLPTTHPINGSQLTLDGVGNARVHASGEVWATTMWDAYNAMLQREDRSFEESRGHMMDYMVAGLQMTPAAPTFTEARDGMLAAALAHDFEDYQLMRAAFTKRGMGPAAVSPARFDPGYDNTVESQGHAGVVEDFTMGMTAVEITKVLLDANYNGLDGTHCDLDDILDVNETAQLQIHLMNLGVQPVSGLQAKVTSNHSGIEFHNDGMMTFTDLAEWKAEGHGTVSMTLNELGDSTTADLTIQFISDDEDLELPNDINLQVSLNYDILKDANRTVEDFEMPETVWRDWQKAKKGADGSGLASWLEEWSVIADEGGLGWGTGNFMWGPDLQSSSDVVLHTPAVTVADSGDFSMNFTHYYQFEAGAWDTGVIEIKIDDADWVDVTTAGGVFAVGYNGVTLSSNPILSERPAFVETSSDGFAAESITFADGLLNGKEVMLRFRIGSDSAVGDWGWNIDNLSFTNISSIPFSNIFAEDNVCVNHAPIVSATPIITTELTANQSNTVTLTVDIFDHDGDVPASYQWMQTSGPSVELIGADTPQPTFTVPPINKDTTFSFDVNVSDGISTGTGKVVVHIDDVNSIPVPTTSESVVNVDEQTSITLSVEANDPDNSEEELTYIWLVDGAQVNNNSSSYQYNAPKIVDDKTVKISVKVADGLSTSEPLDITVNINNVTGGGSSSTGLWSLLLAPLAMLRRRKSRS